MNNRSLILMIVALAFLPASATASGVVHRFVLATGANFGGHDRVPLQYAVSDAERFADVLVGMGGVDPADRMLLEDPDPREFESAMRELAARVSTAQAAAGRTEVMFYYSGHADENGLLLGSQRVSYDALRGMLDAIPANVRISVLDACASGAITRTKGGQRRPAFLVDASSDMEGYAFLTSSSADEAAQESDRIGASFFTHYLVSGLRGAADVSGEGKVTLGEAYQFAFHETLATTEHTQGGAQHPAYHINLSGTGDVVMTDVRETSAGLLLTEELSGRFYIRDEREQLVAELYKPAGRSVELGLEPGTYSIHLEQERQLLLSTPELGEGERLLLTEEDFEYSDREPTVLRGAPRAVGGYDRRGRRLHHLSGRFAVSLGLGWSATGPKTQQTTSGIVTTQVSSWGFMPVLRLTHWSREDLAFDLSISAQGADVSSDISTQVASEVLSLLSILIDVRKYPTSISPRSAMRPYVSVGVGTWIATTDRTSVGSQVVTQIRTEGAIGGQLGGGVDIPLNRRILLGAKGAYNLVADFDEPLGGRKNYSGFESSISVNVLFGG